jgi:hypothetical protein
MPTEKRLEGETPNEVAPAPSHADRYTRAHRYFEEDLQNQRGWYSKRAKLNKIWAQTLSLAIILCGALVTFLQIFDHGLWVSLTTGALGLLVAVAQGAQRVWKFDETWTGYRAASERMKREWRLYINAAGDYAAITEERDAYRRFVEAIEQIIAEEQQIFWQTHNKIEAPEDKPADNG